MNTTWRRQLDGDGYTLVHGVYSHDAIDTLIDRLTAAIEAPKDAGAIRSRTGQVYASRNVLSLFPETEDVWQREPLLAMLREVLGPGFGLVRALFFDKPPEKSWSLPWHKDLTIAVKRNDLPSTHFTNPTRKAGVPHMVAPQSLLRSMLTLRIHLDTVTEENGPLLVIPGSQRCDDAPGGSDPETILTTRGDVLAMRPLLSHRSVNARPETTRHRRILHLEFAARRELPDGYEWHDFLPASNGDFANTFHHKSIDNDSELSDDGESSYVE